MKFPAFLILSLLSWAAPFSVWASGHSRMNAHSRDELVHAYFERGKNGVDATEVAHITADEIRRAWSGLEGDPEQLPLDMNVLLGFNLRAADLWTRLVACNDHDAEVARLAYYLGNHLCADSSEETSVREDLGKLTTGIQDFLVTSSYNRYRAFFAQRKKAYPLMHPLFTELVFEATMEAKSYAQLEHRKTFGTGFEPAGGSLEEELEYAVCPSETKREVCKRDTSRTPEYWPRTYINGLEILQVVIGSRESLGCARYGLFPTASLIAVATLDMISGKSSLPITRGDSHLKPDQRRDPLEPSCWGEGSQWLLAPFQKLWFFRTNDGKGVDFPYDLHSTLVAETVNEFVRIRKTWYPK